MSLKFARQMERNAQDLARDFETQIDGIKPWYSYAGLFDRPATRVFIGLNPGGSSVSEDLDVEYRSAVHKNLRYCSWVDEAWERRGGGLYPVGDSPLQNRAQRAFRVMYEEGWEDVLRNTPCFNVVPFRTRRGADLPQRAWNAATVWFQEVLEHLRPNLIICNGNSAGRSPWSALAKYRIEPDASGDIPTRPGAGAYIKIGKAASSPLAGTTILALPHLSTFGGDDLFRELRKLRKLRSGLFM